MSKSKTKEERDFYVALAAKEYALKNYYGKEFLKEVEAAYDLNYVKFLPHFPAELFSADYVPELLKETERVGVVARGFFGKYRYELKENTLIIRIPFSEAGIQLIRSAHTPDIMSRILKSEFDLNVTVEVQNSEDMQDVLTELRVWEDDAQVAAVHLEKHRTDAEPRIAVRVRTVDDLSSPEHFAFRGIAEQEGNLI